MPIHIFKKEEKPPIDHLSREKGVDRKKIDRPILPDCRTHFDVPRSFGARIPLILTGSGFGPFGGVPPWKAPALAVRDACAQFAAAFMLLSLPSPPLSYAAMSLSKNGKTADWRLLCDARPYVKIINVGLALHRERGHI